jgi:hypothetical protein
MFRIPAFPLVVNVWRAATPTSFSPDVVSPGNLQMGRAVVATTGIPATPSTDTQLVRLLLPALTDVRDSFSAGGPDQVEVPAGSARFYFVKQVDDVAKGFPNEFRLAVIAKVYPWPAPIP